VDLGGIVVRNLDLDTPIQAQKTAGRPQELRAVTELEILQEHPQNRPSQDR
jgi:hypothetical protein